MKKISVAMLVLILAGCASDTHLREADDAYRYRSDCHGEMNIKHEVVVFEFSDGESAKSDENRDKKRHVKTRCVPYHEAKDQERYQNQTS